MVGTQWIHSLPCVKETRELKVDQQWGVVLPKLISSLAAWFREVNVILLWAREIISISLHSILTPGFSRDLGLVEVGTSENGNQDGKGFQFISDEEILKESGRLSVEKKRGGTLEVFFNICVFKVNIHLLFYYYFKNHIFSIQKWTQPKRVKKKGKSPWTVLSKRNVNILMNILLDSTLQIHTHAVCTQFYMKVIKLIFFSLNTILIYIYLCQLGHRI